MRQTIEHLPPIDFETFPVGFYFCSWQPNHAVIVTCIVFHGFKIIFENAAERFTNQDFEYVFTQMLFPLLSLLVLTSLAWYYFQ